MPPAASCYAASSIEGRRLRATRRCPSQDGSLRQICRRRTDGVLRAPLGRGLAQERGLALCGERPELHALGIDLEREAAIPVHDYESRVADVPYDAAIASAELGIFTRVTDELDPRSDRDAGPDPCRKKLCTMGVHDVHIGFRPRFLEPPLRRRRGRTRHPPEEVAGGRRTAPNTTA
jgi:hypothetical protein